MQESAEIVVVGAGIAGLAAALELEGRDYVLLESSQRVGGRLMSEPRGTYWLNFGAHVFGGRESKVGQLIDRFVVEARAARGPVTALAFRNKLLANGRPESYPFLLEISVKDRIMLIKTGLRIRKCAREYQKVTEVTAGGDPGASARRAFSFRDNESFAEFLGPLSPDLDSIFRAISNRAGAPPEEVSAGHGVAAFALTLTKRPVLSRNIVGGSSALPKAISRDLGDGLKLGAAVTLVTSHKDGVRVSYRNSHGAHVIAAKAAIVTTPAYVTASIVDTMPTDTKDALLSIRYGPSVVMALLTNERDAMPWDDLYALTVPNSAFNMFFNIAHVLRVPGAARRPGGSLMIYCNGEPARQMMNRSDDEIRLLFLADLHRLFPETQGIVDETVIQRWPAAAPYAFIGRAGIQSALEADLAPIYLAGDYLGASFTETAVASAQEAARKAISLIEKQERS